MNQGVTFVTSTSAAAVSSFGFRWAAATATATAAAAASGRAQVDAFEQATLLLTVLLAGRP